MIVADIYFVADILSELVLYIVYIPIGFRKALRWTLFSPGRVEQPFIPEESEPLEVLSDLFVEVVQWP